jgi:hypothetical protein
MLARPVGRTAQEIAMLAERSRSRPVALEQDGLVGTAADRERFTLRGAEMVNRLRAVVHDGNVLRIRIRRANGQTLIEIPSLLGIRTGGRLLPVIAAVRALASVSGELTVEVERENSVAALQGLTCARLPVLHTLGTGGWKLLR